VHDEKEQTRPKGEKLNEVLQRAKAEWEAAFDAISEGIVVTETDGRIRRVNRALAELLGRDVRSMTGLKCCDVFGHHRAQDGACPVLNYPNGKQGAFEIFFPDYRYYEDSIHPIGRGSRPQGFVITVRDVTREQLAAQERRNTYLQAEEAARKRKLAEEALHAVQKELLRADRAAAIGNLAAVILQETQRGVNYVREGLEHVAALCTPADGKSDSCGNVIADLGVAAGRTGRVLEKLSRLRIDSRDEPGTFGLNALIEEVAVGMEKPLAEAGVTLRLQLKELPELPGSRSQIAAVLSSLMLNALEATRVDKGAITVLTRRERQSARIEIRDSGRGIEAVHLPQIFNPFFTTHPSAGSVGLGLTICLAIIQGHHGHIQVDSEPAVGTTVHITLPLCD